ncbi:MAG: DUF721 domain-containing protein [Candidatus Marinimicrobia bacterium]|jgi:predicted nucleic acid-binding Zn ribbon protein|nr:DUF721 domain-containing protein [Candidatus Neomarinimicrobiota bacterium]|tara:strand:- start:695 stop:970 length:276 start_codon:yes stop_codon:yes gene_type:complete
MQPLGKAIRSVLKSVGIDRAVLQNEALVVWEKVVGKAVAENTTPEEVKHGTLIVKVSTPVWRNELAMRKGEILEKLNDTLGKKVIRDLRLI